MIETRDLTKKYGTDAAVAGITFTVRRGEIVGFLGPNGAGKTTTMRMLTGFFPPTSGTAAVAGFDVVSGSLDVRRRVGYLPETTPLYPDLTPIEYLEFIGSLRGLRGQALASAVARVVESCALSGVLGKDIGELSKGYRQRVGIAQAILHNPDLLILDEPTSGLDPSQVVEVRELISMLGKEKTVILSTHVLSEVQAVATRVIILAGGRIVADGQLSELGRQMGHTTIHVQVKASEPLVREKLEILAGQGRVRTRQEGDVVHAQVETSEDLREAIFRQAIEHRWTLLELQRRQPGLEEIFLRLTGGIS